LSVARRNSPQLDGEVTDAFIQTARPNTPIRRKRLRARAIANLMIVAVVVVVVLNGYAALQNYRTAVHMRATENSIASPAFKSRYDILGAQVVESWLSGGQPPVDMVDGIKWPSSTDRGFVGIDVVSIGYLGGTTVPLEGTSDFHESLTYSVIAADGSQYLVTIDMGIVRDASGKARPILFGAALVEPRNSVSVVTGTGKPAWPTFAVSEGSAVAGRVNEWVDAWTSNNTGALKALTGDPSPATYTGMQSAQTWEVVPKSVHVLWAVVRPDDGNVVLRVTWDIQTPEVTTPSSPSLPGGSVLGEVADDDAAVLEPVSKRIRQSADLLIGDAATGLPRVLAWGAPGASLTEYQNSSTAKG